MKSMDGTGHGSKRGRRKGRGIWALLGVIGRKRNPWDDGMVELFGSGGQVWVALVIGVYQ